MPAQLQDCLSCSPWGQDLGCGPDFITYQQMQESQPSYFPFPSREIILGRHLALRASARSCFYWLAGTSRHLAHGSVHARAHTRGSGVSYPRSGTEQVGELLGFCLRSFQCKFMGATASSWTAVSFPCSPPGRQTSSQEPAGHMS